MEIRARYGSIRAATPIDVFRASAGGAFLVVASEDGAALGCAGLERLELAGTAEVRKFFVVAEARGRGLSRLLLEAIESRAVALGYTRLRLDTGARQHEALGLYRSAGYAEIPDYNGNPLAAHWLEKDLPGGA